MISKLGAYRPVSRIDDGPRDTRYKAFLFHTAVTTASSLYGWWTDTGPNGPPPGVGAHFYINRDGGQEQYLDTDRQTGHAYDANGWSVACEFWDNGDPANTPFTDAQVDAAVALLNELGVPPVLIDCPGPADGIGWHEKCSTWNQSHHTCPGSLREQQIRDVILPRLTKGADQSWLAILTT